MDVLVINNVAWELFPEGAPDLHPDLLIVNDYQGNVVEGMYWNEETETFEYNEEHPAPTWLPDVPQDDD